MDPSPSSPPPTSCTTSGRFLRLSCSAPLLHARLPSPTTSPLQPVRKLPLRAPSAVILRSLPYPSLLFSFFYASSIRTGWYAQCRTILPQRCDQPLLRLPGARRDFSQSTMFLIPAFITFGS